ncbi:MAG TPA: hypothetical protein VH595_09885 [Verrucomicrobiae bacterium]|jgi:hypothetical protein|nr:hypothetical protein [Verrucomicrobiae bacterium]
MTRFYCPFFRGKPTMRLRRVQDILSEQNSAAIEILSRCHKLLVQALEETVPDSADSQRKQKRRPCSDCCAAVKSTEIKAP